MEDVVNATGSHTASSTGSRPANATGSRPAPRLCIVVPCYNERECLPLSMPVLVEALSDLVRRGLAAAGSSLLFVDDGSADATWDLIARGAAEHPGVVGGIRLAHNEGHQRALVAGLAEALDRGFDAAISLDTDLQDDPKVMAQMLERYRDGVEVVFGARDDRATDTAFKRGTANAFYGLMGALGVEMVPNSADYRLMGRRALEALSLYQEENLFLRGIVPAIGFRTDVVYYRRAERAAGESKYPLKKMLAFAFEGITSFSVTPIRFVFVLGVIALVVALAVTVYALVRLAQGVTVPGWTSLMVSIWFVGGLVMLSLGVVGEYVGRIYLESKRRPRYVIAERLG